MLRMICMMLVLGAAAAVSGCATIVHSGPRNIPIASTPKGAKVSIYDRMDSLVMVNTTPFVAPLNTKFGYFKSQSYRLVFEMPGYNPAEINLNSSVSGWYFGNLLFGGVIGMLIVDPLTGAMFNLTPEKIEQHMSPAQAQLIRNGQGLLIVLAAQTTQQERDDMVRVN
jgi:hypothetical protein